jgi:hypothetical protein
VKYPDTSFISMFFGTQKMAGLMGLLIFTANIGGA